MTNATNAIWRVWARTSATTSATATWDTTGLEVFSIWAEECERIFQTTGFRREQFLPPPRVTAEERARREAEFARYRQQAEEAEAARVEANRKAEILLQSLLTPEQRADLKTKQCFFLHTGGKRYRVDRGQHGNVKLLDDKGGVVESYCIQPKGGLPDADAMAAQKLLLETDPATFRKIANITTREGRVIHGIAI